MHSWLLWVLLVTLRVRGSLGQNGSELPIPQQVKLEEDLTTQKLFVSWESDASFFDIEVIRTELMEVVLNETVEVRVDLTNGKHHWNWTSAVPLQCTSHSVRLRSRDQHSLSHWSPLETIAGSDIPEKEKAQMYPVDKVVFAGSSTTFCCIVGEGKEFGKIWYKDKKINETMLSRRSYAITMPNQEPSNISGTNVVCLSKSNEISTGTVVFVGYPPGDQELVCETRDLVSAECQWIKGRDTHLNKRSLRTNYTLNGRVCADSNKKKKKQCSWKEWESNWTLVAQNPLGVVRLTDSAALTGRVHPLAPINLTTPDINAWNASLQWSWEVERYKMLSLICQVQLTNNGLSVMRNYNGAGLSGVLLEGLQPDEDYTVMVRCGSHSSFWRWGDWSSVCSFRSQMDRPEAPDIWIWMDSDTTGRVLWKPLSKTASHGPVAGYEVTQGGPEEEQPTLSLPQDQHSSPVSLVDRTSDLTVSVSARNPAGLSLPASLLIPKFWSDAEETVSEIIGSNGGFDLSWTASANASHGYAVEWLSTGCGQVCHVEWLKVPEGSSSARVQSGSLMAGVRYTVSVFALSTEAPELLERRRGYVEEMVPAQSVLSLAPNQYGSDVQLSWEGVSLENQRGFIRGYTIYLTNVSHLELLANISDPHLRNYTVRKLSLGSYKFTVKAYTSAGEDGGSTVSIKLEPYTDMLIMEILVSLGAMTCFLLLVTMVCYRKRKWVKKAFYPEIPEPKLPGDWSTTQGTLDVKPSPHSMVHIEENPEWDSSKEGLVVVPEDDREGEGSGNEPADTDSDEPALLRYYNQVVSDSSQGPCMSDSSASSTSSMGSTQTDVTYTGIQTSASSLGTPTQPDSQCGGGYRPQMQPTPCPVEAQADQEPPTLGSFGGYKPQCSWKLDSPEAGSLDSSMGSPTSVTSSQFLIPDEAPEEVRDQPSSTTWFHNLLSGKP